MRQLEIPYNFDLKLIDGLRILDKNSDYIYCIYCQPYIDDYEACKSNYIHNNNGNYVDMLERNQMTRQEYETHINYINTYFPNKIMLLLQQPNKTLNNLKYYYDLGFRKFCVGSLKQAEIIFQNYQDVEIIGSITMRMSLQDFYNPIYQKYFNGFVLFFPFNRDFLSIQQLPEYFEYSLLVNCGCNIYCEGMSHWFADRELTLKGIKTCPQSNKNLNSKENSIFISPVDLVLFEPYIKYFKLQGREHATSEILRDFVLYTTSFSSTFYLKNPSSFYQQINADNQISKIKELKNEK